MIWDAERVEALTRLWREGYSCARIAAELGAGISRNAVTGKVLRLELRDKYPRSQKPKIKRQRGSHAARSWACDRQRIHRADTHLFVPAKPPESVVVVEPIPFLNSRSNTCRFPLWGDSPVPIAEKLCCGAPVVVGKSWCAMHRAIVFTT